MTGLSCRTNPPNRSPLLLCSIRHWLRQGVRNRRPFHKPRAALLNHVALQRNSCPTCRRRLIDSIPAENIQLPELVDVDQELSEHVRQIGNFSLTDEQSEALGAAVLLLAQGDTEAQLDFPQGTDDSSHGHAATYGGMYS